jgi:hypothetical protein
MMWQRAKQEISMHKKVLKIPVLAHESIHTSIVGIFWQDTKAILFLSHSHNFSSVEKKHTFVMMK